MSGSANTITASWVGQLLVAQGFIDVIIKLHI